MQPDTVAQDSLDVGPERAIETKATDSPRDGLALLARAELETAQGLGELATLPLGEADHVGGCPTALEQGGDRLV